MPTACVAAHFVSLCCSCVTRWAFGDALGAVRSEVRAVSFKWRACIVLQARHFASMAPLWDGWTLRTMQSQRVRRIAIVLQFSIRAIFA